MSKRLKEAGGSLEVLLQSTGYLEELLSHLQSQEEKGSKTALPRNFMDITFFLPSKIVPCVCGVASVCDMVHVGILVYVYMRTYMFRPEVDVYLVSFLHGYPSLFF